MEYTGELMKKLRPFLEGEGHAYVKLLDGAEIQENYPRFVTVIQTANRIFEDRDVNIAEKGPVLITAKMEYALNRLESTGTEDEFVQATEELMYVMMELVFLISTEVEGPEAAKAEWAKTKAEIKDKYLERFLPAIREASRVHVA